MSIGTATPDCNRLNRRCACCPPVGCPKTLLNCVMSTAAFCSTALHNLATIGRKFFGVVQLVYPILFCHCLPIYISSLLPCPCILHESHFIWPKSRVVGDFFLFSFLLLVLLRVLDLGAVFHNLLLSKHSHREG